MSRRMPHGRQGGCDHARPGTRQCDGVLTEHQRTVLVGGSQYRVPDRVTCDVLLCVDCTYRPEPGLDYCPDCREARARQLELFT